MMSSKDSMALAVGQAMLDRIAASAPELSGVGDIDHYNRCFGLMIINRPSQPA